MTLRQRVRHRLTQLYNWVIELEMTRTSVLHAALYAWLALGLVGVEVLHWTHGSVGKESINGLLGNGFWWWGWLHLLIGCNVMFAVSQWMIFRGGHKKVRYAGFVAISGADIGALLGVTSYFVALYAQADLSASANWFRMCMASFIITALVVFVVRDIHRLTLIEVVRVRRGG